MPSRVLHDSILSSPSLATCSPRAQDSFPRFLLLADDFGCFEAAPRVLLGRGWPYRTDVTELDVRAWLIEYATAGMVQLWEHGGRWWAHLKGWFTFQRERGEYSPKNPHGSKRKTPVPPPSENGGADSLAAFSSCNSRGESAPGNADVVERDRGFPLPQSQSQSQSKVQPVESPNGSPTARAPRNKPSHPDHKRFVDGFTALFTGATGNPPTWTATRGRQVRDLLQAHGFDEVMRRAEILCRGEGPEWLTREGFDLGTLVAHFDKLTQPSKPRRPAANPAEAARATLDRNRPVT